MEIWIESDLLGNRSVMLKSPIDGEPAIKYCTFHYHLFTDNAKTLSAAENMAKSLGATGDIKNINIGCANQTKGDK